VKTPDLEASLRDAYAASIPPHLGAQLDRRVAAAVGVAATVAECGGSKRAVALARPRPHRLVLIAALLTVAIATIAAGVSLLFVTVPPEVFYPSDGGIEWTRGQPLGMTQVVDGFSVTLERAYADGAQAMVAVSTRDTANRGWQVEARGITLSDTSGIDWQMATGLGAPGSATDAAELVWYRAASLAPPGTRTFHVVVGAVAVGGAPDEHGDPWRTIDVNAEFTFQLTVAGGVDVTANVSDQHHGVTATLDRAMISPSIVRLDLRLAGLAGEPSDWSPILTVQHAGQTIEMESAAAQIGSTSLTVYTKAGVDDPSGDWIVTISEVVDLSTSESPSPEATQVRLRGPWVLHFSAP
jgi:hypothetical protein